MKKDILKIAGVKSEKEFYKKYPTEAAFMKAHKKEFKKAAMGASMVNKQLTQLTDFSNPPQAEVGDYIGGGQSAAYKPLNYTELYDKADYANTGSNRQMRMQDANLAAQQKIAANSGKGFLGQLMGDLQGMTGELDALSPDSSGVETGGGSYNNGINETGASFADVGKNGKRISRAQNGFDQKMQGFNQKIGQGFDKLDTGLKGVGGVSGALSIGTDLLGGFQELKQEKDLKKQAKQSFKLSELTKEVTGLPQDIAQRKYIRPEDQAFGTQQMGQAYGAGTNFLAEYGARVGGNPTEIQNMYNPGDIYSDMGYEPLSDSEIVKQYRRGGLVPKALVGGPFDKMAGQAGGALGSLIGGNKGKPTAGGKIGSTIGSTAGNLILPGVGGIIGGAIGGIAGGVLGGKSAAETARYEEGAQQNLQDTAFMSGAQGLRGQFGNVMKDGGWVSHNWQPQVIAKFGEYDMKDLLRADPTMDTLRAGGNITAQKGKTLLPSNPSGYADSVINANQNIQFYKDVLAKKAPEISQFPGMFSETEIRGMDDSSEENPYVGSITGVKPYFSYVNGKYIPIEGMKEAYEDKTIPSINFPSQYAASVFDEEMKKRTKKQRSGGNLKDLPYTPLTESAMSTERPDFAMGGQLKTTWGGDAETISRNPYLPGTGETVMFRGQSHDESDGNGNTGIGVKYGQGAQDSYTDYAEYGTEQAGADVEVERGEPATELTDAETGDVSMVVYGNMPIPSYGAAELGDPKIKGKKFKSYANDLSKMEAKQNKIVEKGTKLVDSMDGDNPFDLLKLNAGQAMVQGANMKLKGLAIQKQRLAGIQNAILDTAEEMGVESDALAKGQIKQAKGSDMAKFGGKFTQAQVGINQPLSPIWPMSTYYNITPKTDFKMETAPELKKAIEEQAVATQKKTGTKSKSPAKATERVPGKPITSIDIPKKDIKKQLDTSAKNMTAEVPDYVKKMGTFPTADKKDKFGLDDLLRQVQPYLLPSNQEDFDYRQIAPELASIAMNPLEAVQAQTFQPLLEQPYTVSLQDQLNANQADFNALQRQMGYNPAAASALAAQKYAANSAVLGQQARINQELQMGAFNRNRGVLNETALKNLEILDKQYLRQSQAKSNTKAQAHAALTSIADKMAKHKLENRTLGVYENMYNYRFGPKGRAYSVNAPYEFNKDLAGMSNEEIDNAYSKLEKEKKSRQKDTAKNGGIVKAIKNL